MTIEEELYRDGVDTAADAGRRAVARSKNDEEAGAYLSAIVSGMMVQVFMADMTINMAKGLTIDQAKEHLIASFVKIAQAIAIDLKCKGGGGYVH